MTTLTNNVFRMSATLAASFVLGMITPANAQDLEPRHFVEAMNSVAKQIDTVASQDSATNRRTQQLASDIVDVIARMGDKSSGQLLAEFADLQTRAHELLRESEDQARDLDTLDDSLKGMVIRAGKYASEKSVRNAYESADRASQDTHRAIGRTQQDLRFLQETVRDLASMHFRTAYPYWGQYRWIWN